MSSILIRDIDERTLTALKKLADRHHRSLQGELHYILEQASELEKSELLNEELNLITVHTGYSGTWNREDIYGNDGR